MTRSRSSSSARRATPPRGWSQPAPWSRGEYLIFFGCQLVGAASIAGVIWLAQFDRRATAVAVIYMALTTLLVPFCVAVSFSEARRLYRVWPKWSEKLIQTNGHQVDSYPLSRRQRIFRWFPLLMVPLTGFTCWSLGAPVWGAVLAAVVSLVFWGLMDLVYIEARSTFRGEGRFAQQNPRVLNWK